MVITLLFSGFFLVYSAIKLDGINHGHLWGWQSLSIGLTRTIFGFTYGLLLYQIWLKQSINYISTIKSLILILIVINPLCFNNIGQLNGLIDCIGVFIFYPFLILQCAKVNPTTQLARVFKILGIISYPIYLLHTLFGAGIKNVLSLLSINVEQFEPISGILLVSVLIFVSLLLDRVYDSRIRSYFLQKILT